MSEINQFIISFGSALIVILMSAISFFLIRLVKVVDRLETTVNKMQTSYAVQESRLQQIEKTCEARFTIESRKD